MDSKTIRAIIAQSRAEFRAKLDPETIADIEANEPVDADGMATLEVDLDVVTLWKSFHAAHEADVTFNEYIEYAIIMALKNLEVT